MENKFELLRNKEIIAILDGDKSFGQDDDLKVELSMPYLSGPALCDLSMNFGLSAIYNDGGQCLSRWNYFDNLLKYCIDENKVSNLLSYLFSNERFKDKLKGFTPQEIEILHKKIIKTIIDRINGILFFGGNELVIIGKQFAIKNNEEVVNVETPIVKTIDRDYINDLSQRAFEDIEKQNYDSAITKSRTILEETFCYVIEQKNQEPSSSGDIGKLYLQVKDLYNMHADKAMDKRINKLLSGLEKIVSSISEMRNKESDSHGVGKRRIGISDYHARLFNNAAVMMADFILSVCQANLKQ